MAIQLKVFGGYRYQILEEEFNRWADELSPYLIKTVLNASPVPRNEQGFSLYFTLAVFYQHDPPEYIKKEARK